MIRVTIACPESMMSDANALASVLGLHPDDVLTFTDLTHEDANGARYSVASLIAEGDFPDRASTALVEPAWGADMAAAGRAQAALAVYAGEDDDPFAAPDRLAAVIGWDVDGALAVMGLTPHET